VKTHCPRWPHGQRGQYHRKLELDRVAGHVSLVIVDEFEVVDVDQHVGQVMEVSDQVLIDPSTEVMMRFTRPIPGQNQSTNVPLPPGYLQERILDVWTRRQPLYVPAGTVTFSTPSNVTFSTMVPASGEVVAAVPHDLPIAMEGVKRGIALSYMCDS